MEGTEAKVPMFYSRKLRCRLFFAGYSIHDGKPLGVEVIDPEGRYPFPWPDDAEFERNVAIETDTYETLETP